VSLDNHDEVSRADSVASLGGVEFGQAAEEVILLARLPRL